jgi:cytoskeletal protein CcmA (bactofilin family)/ribosomal protein S27E
VSKQDKASLACPKCGHEQLVAKAAFSAVCRNCGLYWRVQDLLKPALRPATARPEQRHVVCFDCATELTVPANAQSTMCKHCSTYIDLQDYSITTAVSKNFKTMGTFVIQPTGYVFNSETKATDAVIKGRFIGKLAVARSLTLHSTAQIKGSFWAGVLVVPAGNTFHWPTLIRVESAELEGELVADLEVTHGLIVRPGGRFFGNLKATTVLVEPGAVLVGSARIGQIENAPAAAT